MQFLQVFFPSAISSVFTFVLGAFLEKLCCCKSPNKKIDLLRMLLLVMFLSLSLGISGMLSYCIRIFVLE